MPRFFLHVRKPSGAVTQDPSGLFLDGLEAAEEEAIVCIQVLRRELRGSTGANDLERWVLEIADRDGRVLRTIAFSDVSRRCVAAWD